MSVVFTEVSPPPAWRLVFHPSKARRTWLSWSTARSTRLRRVHLDTFFAPVQWSRKVNHPTVTSKAVILNSGGASACTGAGYAQSFATAESGRQAHNENRPQFCDLFYTGLIGELLPLDNELFQIARGAHEGSRRHHQKAAPDAPPRHHYRHQAEDESNGPAPTAGDPAAHGQGSSMVPATGHHVVRHHHRWDSSSPVRCRPLAVAAKHSFNRIDVDGCMSMNDTDPATRLHCLWR